MTSAAEDARTPGTEGTGRHNDADLRSRALALEAAGDWREALAAWTQVDRACPGDAAAAQGIADLTIEECRVRGGLAEPVPGRFPLPAETPAPSTPMPGGTRFDLQQAVQAVDGAAAVCRTPVQQLESAVREFPSQPELYLELAPLYLQRGRLYDAERLLSKGVTATGQDVRVRRMWEDVTLERLEEEIRQSRKDVERSDERVTREALAQAEREQRRVRLEILQQRAQREPDNGQILLELGRHLKQAGRLREAIKAFHQAIADVRSTPVAAWEAADCYAQDGDAVDALRLLRLAAQPSLAAPAFEVRQQALARAAELAATLKLAALAEYYRAQARRLVGEE